MDKITSEFRWMCMKPCLFIDERKGTYKQSAPLLGHNIRLAAWRSATPSTMHIEQPDGRDLGDDTLRKQKEQAVSLHR